MSWFHLLTPPRPSKAVTSHGARRERPFHAAQLKIAAEKRSRAFVKVVDGPGQSCHCQPWNAIPSIMPCRLCCEFCCGCGGGGGGALDCGGCDVAPLSGEPKTGHCCGAWLSTGVSSMPMDGTTLCGGTGAFCSGKGVQKALVAVCVRSIEEPEPL